MKQALLSALMLFTLTSSPWAQPSPVYARFDLASIGGAPFPSDLYTVADPRNRTGRRVNNITALAIDPQRATTLNAETSDRGVFKTTDAGATWSATGLTNVDVYGDRSAGSEHCLCGYQWRRL